MKRVQKPTSLKRMLNIAQRMIEGHEVFYASSASPRMSFAEWKALDDFGFCIQEEWPHPPESRMYYAMCENGKDEINKKKLFELRRMINNRQYIG